MYIDTQMQETTDFYHGAGDTALKVAHALGELGRLAHRVDDRELLRNVLGWLSMKEGEAKEEGRWMDAAVMDQERMELLGIDWMMF